MFEFLCVILLILLLYLLSKLVKVIQSYEQKMSEKEEDSYISDLLEQDAARRAREREYEEGRRSRDKDRYLF